MCNCYHHHYCCICQHKGHCCFPRARHYVVNNDSTFYVSYILGVQCLTFNGSSKELTRVICLLFSSHENIHSAFIHSGAIQFDSGDIVFEEDRLQHSYRKLALFYKYSQLNTAINYQQQFFIEVIELTELFDLSISCQLLVDFLEQSVYPI